MPTTPNYNLPYPAPGDAADVPVDLAELAVAVDTALGAVQGPPGPPGPQGIQGPPGPPGADGSTGLAPPDQQAFYGAGDYVDCPPGVKTALPFGFTADDAELLDLTDPLEPRVIEAGIYALTAVTATNSPMTAPALVYVTLTLDTERPGVAQATSSMALGPGLQGTLPALTAVWYFPAGAPIQVSLLQWDPTATIRAFIGSFLIRRLTMA